MPKFRNIRTFKHIISAIIWFFIGVILLAFVLLRLPAVQSFLGEKVASSLSEKLGTEVTVGKVDIGLISTRITIDDVLIRDQQSKPMISASRLSANIDVMPLFDGKVSVNSAQLFGLKGAFYQEDADSRPNFAFLVDSLFKSKQEKSKLDLSIKSLILRNASLSYQRMDLPPTHRFDPAHLAFSELSGHFMLHHLTDNELSVDVKKLTFKESSGLHVKSLDFDLHSNTNGTTMEQLSLVMPNSTLRLSDVQVNYRYGNKERVQLNNLSYQANVEIPTLRGTDLACFLPQLGEYPSSLSLHTQLSGHQGTVSLKHLAINSSDNDIQLDADANLSHITDNMAWNVDIRRLAVASGEMERLMSLVSNQDVANILHKAGTLALTGKAKGDPNLIDLTCQLKSDMGEGSCQFNRTGSRFSATIDTGAFHLDRLMGDDFGLLNAHLSVDGTWPIDQHTKLKLDGSIPLFAYKGKDIQNMTINGIYSAGNYDGSFAMNSPDGDIKFDGLIHFRQPISGTFTAQVDHFNPYALGLTEKWQGYSLTCSVDADMESLSNNGLQGRLTLNDLILNTPGNQLYLDQLTASAQGAGNMSLSTDFCEVESHGTISLASLQEGLFYILSDKIPALPGLIGKNAVNHGGHFTLSARLEDSDWYRQVLKVPLSLHQPMYMEMEMDEKSHSLEMTLDMPDIAYGNHRYANVLVGMDTENDTLKCNASLVKVSDKGNDIDVGMKAMAFNNVLHTDFDIDTHGKRPMHGIVSASTQFFRADDGAPTAHAVIHQSRLFVGDEEWRIQPSDILYSRNGLLIDNLALTNHGQHLIVNGRIRPNSNDTLFVDINRVDMEYLSSLMGVKNVSFGGMATGRLFAHSLYSNPEAQGMLKVDDFSFVDGRMGDMTSALSWDKNSNKLQIDAIIDNGPNSQTFVDGGVGFGNSELDINIHTYGSPLTFLNHYCRGFLSDVNAQSNGDVRICGTFKQPNLEGKAVVNGTVKLRSLNTIYTLKDDTISLSPGLISFASDTVYDRHDHIAVISGNVTHRYLGPFNADVRIHADNALVYDFPTMGNNNFYGTVYATGDCHIQSKSGETNIDVNATPNANSIIVYNASSPDAISNQSFIQWNDITPAQDTLFVARDVIPQEEEDTPSSNMPSNLHMNLMVNATPDATLRVLMNEESGDYIDLLGNGMLRISYFNKGAFNIFGNYVVDHGVYKMTIQNVLAKDFQFQEGGTIAFGGDPLRSALDLKALYTVNGVSLSDLNIGRNFSTNNIRVNCIMNITGTMDSPNVDFDMEMPTVNADAQQMVRSLVNSEEEMNQQVIYLLTIGRFYSQSGNNSVEESDQSQTSLAMQSLLSGTISQQINNVLSSVLNNSNWNFGANISTGDEGWNNAEYEGILSGRLLNNRLLINGQFGYRDNSNATSSFIGDFDVRYLLFPNGNLAVRVYNQTNDRYFTKNSLNTQGIGLIMKKDFNGWRDLFGIKSKEQKVEDDKEESNENGPQNTANE